VGDFDYVLAGIYESLVRFIVECSSRLYKRQWTVPIE
jgi:hypothetical protein